MFSTDRVTAYLIQRGFQGVDAQTYTELTIQMGRTLLALAEHTEEDVRVAIKAFNDVFVTTTLLASIIVPEAPSQNFPAVDSAFVTELQRYRANDIGMDNLITLFLQMYQTTNVLRAKHNLVYHQARHAIEMCLDNAKLLEANAQLGDCKLLMALCGLYHDVIYTGVRVGDEQASAKQLAHSLSPVLQKLSANQSAIITNIIEFIILAGTTPTFFGQNEAGQAYTTLEGVYRIVDALLKDQFAIDNPVYQQMMDLARQISHCDVNRTSLLDLFADQALYIDAHWQSLAWLYDDISDVEKITLQRKLTQDLRVLFELNATKPHLAALAVFSAHCQAQDLSQESQVKTALTVESIAAFAHVIGGDENPFSEVAFALRMHNSLSQDKATVLRYRVKNTWEIHHKVLKTLHNFLISAAS